MLFDIMERPASLTRCVSFLYGTNINPSIILFFHNQYIEKGQPHFRSCPCLGYFIVLVPFIVPGL